MMVDSGGKVLSHYDFRRRLLEVPGWEQFTALFLFFISEDNKLDISRLGEREKNRARFVGGRREIWRVHVALVRFAARGRRRSRPSRRARHGHRRSRW
jgi:hypothetical protein